jgi:hypothetical protein
MPVSSMRRYVLLIFAALLPLAALAVSTAPVFAQSYCGVQVGSMAASMQYYGSNYYGQNNPWNIRLTVPISMGCPNSGGSLWTVGNIYDTVANTNLGSANVAMNAYNGYYSGQLVFTLPPSVIEHLLQIQISVYNGYGYGQYGSLVASSSPTVTIHSSSSYYNGSTNPYNSYNNGYPQYCYYQNGYMYCYYPTYYYYYSSPSYYTSSCFNGQAITYYNGAYHYVTCYHHHR